MLIAIEGIDGSGKTTTTRLIAEVLAADGWAAVHVDKKSVGAADPVVRERARQLARLIWEFDAPADPLGAEHWLLLIASWYTAIGTIQPLLDPSPERVVLVDGWWYRNVAKTILRSGAAERRLDGLFAAAVRPDLVVLLDVEPAVAWSRAVDPSATELGRWDGHHGDPRESFCAYQSAIAGELRRMARERAWLRCVPEPEDAPAAVAAAVAALCRPHLREDHSAAAVVAAGATKGPPR